MASAPYAGDVSPEEAYARLAQEPGALLVDVRSRPEWTFVGLPDLSEVGKEPLLLEWQSYPAMQVDGGFVSALAAAVEAGGGGRDTPLFFLCRSGGRSASAAAAMTAAGFQNCFNVGGGFEGRPDAEHHRGTLEGWKSSGLPWVQS